MKMRMSRWFASAIRFAMGPLLVLAGGPIDPVWTQASPAGGLSGLVVDAMTLAPIDQVEVRVVGRAEVVRTDAAGRFRLLSAPADSVVLDVRRIGYRAVQQGVAPGQTNVTIRLVQQSLRLDELVVTGTPGEAARRTLGNAVSTIRAREAVELSGAADLGKLVNGRAAGVVVTPGTGLVGSGPSITIRGPSSITLGRNPLLYVDGVRVANDIGTGPQPIAGFDGLEGGGAISRLNDINPEDIESIEIIKGPAAATIYGTEASNGVIQVVTRRGRAGSSPVYQLDVRQGANWFSNPARRIPTVFYPDPASGNIGEWNPVAAEAARGTPLWRTGHAQGYDLALTGGAGPIGIRLSGGFDRDEGIDPTNWARRYAVRANLGYAAGPTLDLRASLGLTRGSTRLGQETGNSTLYGALFGLGPATLPESRGFLGPPPDLFRSDLLETSQTVSRFIGSLEASHRTASWLTQRAVIGLDQIGETNLAFASLMPAQYAGYFGPFGSKGANTTTRRDADVLSIDYGASARATLSRGLGSVSSLGAQFYRRSARTLTVAGQQFPVGGFNPASAGAVRDVGDQRLTNSTLGLFVQQQIGWRDRAFVTGAVRVDNNSAFGDDIRLAAYPKVSVSWVVREETGAGRSWLTGLRLRAAWGASGLQPEAFSALQTYVATTGADDQPAVVPQSVGNPNLKPERSTELEAGFEAALFGRVSLDLTYFDRRTRDVILRRRVAPSTGFPGSGLINAGRTSSHGLELQVEAAVARSRRLGVDLGFTAATSADRIRSLGGLGSIPVLLAQRHVEGYPIGGFFSRRILGGTRDASNQIVDLVCDDGAGGAVACDEAPDVFLGTPTPKVSGALTATITLFDRIRLYGMVDYRLGHRLFEFDRYTRCTEVQNCEANWYPERFDILTAAGIQDPTLFQPYIADAGFAKLREVSAAVSLPGRWARAIGASRATVTFAGRNLHTWTNWTGLDPESRVSPFAQALTFAQTPQLAQFVSTISVAF
jgi:TonB-dependent SusC/RagA subfamily outer membrane receptor